MKNKIVKIIGLALFMYVCFIGKTYAAGAYANIQANKTSCTEGETVTITVSVNAGAWQLNVSGGVTDSIVGYTPIDKEGNTSDTKSYTFSCSTVGNHTVTLSGNYADYETEVETNVSQSVSITVNAKPQQTEPTQPSQPSQPSTPSQPSQPSQPAQPSQPSTPSQPSQPSSPSTGSGNNQTTTKKEETKKETKKEETKKEEPKVDPIVVEKIEVVGHNIKFDNDVLEYTLELDDGVESIYLEVKSNAEVDTKGLVDIKDKKEILITFKKDKLTKTYKIKFKEKNNNMLLSVPKADNTNSSNTSSKYKITTIIFAITTLLLLVSTVVLLILKFKTKKD